MNITVTGSSIPTNTPGGSDDGGGGGNSATIIVRVNGDTPAKECNGQTLKYYQNPTVNITLNGGVSKILYCHGTNQCTPNITAASSTSFTITGKGLYILRIKKFDKNVKTPNLRVFFFE